jgi:hypothetical protein
MNAELIAHGYANAISGMFGGKLLVDFCFEYTEQGHSLTIGMCQI